jgi:hypothetical protein
MSTTSSPSGSSSEVTNGKHPSITYYMGEKHESVDVLSKWTIAITAIQKCNYNVAEILDTTYKKDKTTIYSFHFKFVNGTISLLSMEDVILLDE